MKTKKLVHIMSSIIFIAVAVALLGCQSTPVDSVSSPVAITTTTTTQPPITSIVYQKLAWPQVEYTKIVYELLGNSKLLGTQPKDLSKFCPKLKTTNVDFWAQLISAMAKRESNFKTETTYKESFKDQKGEYVISRGLLQISIESGKSYNKNLKTAQELHDPKVNLKTGILILEKWVLLDNYIGADGSKNLGGSRYWAVLRQNRGDSRAWIENYMKSLTLCK